ncbi:MAG: ATP synthase F1 subunit gamma [Clostridia bacterium]|nr:ATP synthase F1 subunit gamma [Clostridia bacterium]
MSNLKELKSRIKSVNDTKKITSAMYLISSNKMNKAKREFDESRPYFKLLENEIINIFASDVEINSEYFREEHEEIEGTWGYFVLTSDKGLCGSYNINLIKEALPHITGHKDNRVYMIGEYGRNYLLQKKIPVVDDFRYLSTNPTMRRAREIANRFIEDYLDKKITRLFAIYTDFENGFAGGEPKIFEVLPFRREYFEKDRISAKEELRFVPNADSVLNNIVDSYLVGLVYSILAASFCSEQAARMTAMNNANDNAHEILSTLQGEYNKVRQDQITREIIEISSGAKAKKRKQNEGKKKWKEE